VAKRIDSEIVLALREAYCSDAQPTYNELAEQYEVSTSTVAKIVKGQTYADVGGPITATPRRGRKAGKSPAKLATGDEG